jgi:hypothetical protein
VKVVKVVGYALCLGGVDFSDFEGGDDTGTKVDAAAFSRFDVDKSTGLAELRKLRGDGELAWTMEAYDPLGIGVGGIEIELAEVKDADMSKLPKFEILESEQESPNVVDWGDLSDNDTADDRRSALRSREPPRSSMSWFHLS